MLPESWLLKRYLERQTKGRQRTRRRVHKQRGKATQAAHAHDANEEHHDPFLTRRRCASKASGEAAHHAHAFVHVLEDARALQHRRTSVASHLESPRWGGCFPRAGCWRRPCNDEPTAGRRQDADFRNDEVQFSTRQHTTHTPFCKLVMEHVRGSEHAQEG